MADLKLLFALVLCCAALIFSGATGATLLYRQTFSALPTWYSEFSDPSNHAGVWKVAGGGPMRSMQLQATNSQPAVSVKVIAVEQARPHTLIEVTVYMLCPSFTANPYAVKFSVAPDSLSAESLASDTTGLWSTVQEFSSSGTNGNTGWTQYRLTIDTGAANSVSLGFLTSSTSGGIPTAGFSLLEVSEIGCAPNYYGPNCDIFCKDEETCNGHGTCSELGTECICDTNFQGAGCDECIAGHFGPECDQTCDPATTCHGHGTCGPSGQCICTGNFKGVECEECVDNYFGPDCSIYCDAATCNNHGTCAIDGTCSCDPQFAGETCTECQPSWYGANCDTFCSPAQTCNNRGSCSPDDGHCVCGEQFAGPNCEICAPNYYGPDCQHYCDPATTCGGHGSCNPTTGQCHCDVGWAGANCSRCASNYYGPDCQTYCDPAVTCNGHGSCDPSSGQCQCVLGWDGAACDHCANDFYNSDCQTFCNSSVTCNGHGYCDAATGNCICSAEWSGAECDHCAENHYGADCLTFCEPTTTCRGHGDCSSDGACVCHDGWSGSNCENSISLVIPVLSCVIPKNSISDTTFTAYFGYSSTNIGPVAIPVGANNKFEPAPFDRDQPTMFEAGPNNHSFVVDFDTSVAPATISWTLGVTTVTASASSPRCEFHDCPNQCSGHGLCLANNECSCVDGFTGADCSLNLALVVPVLQCVADHNDGTMTAYFAYNNAAGASVSIPYGPHNSLSGVPVQTQPTQFGTSPPPVFPQTQLTVSFSRDSNGVAWTLGTTTSTANADSQRCPAEAPLDPIVQCIVPYYATSEYRAFFGYKNPNNYLVDLPIGPANQFFPSVSQDLGQPTTFAPGVFERAFSVVFNGNELNWQLGSKVVSVSSLTQKCPESECLNDCTGRGMCFAGTCHCDEGWIGDDCSLSAYNITPVLVCVEDHNNGMLTARFAADNRDSAAVKIPIGEQNFFTPSPMNRNQPTLFPPGIGETIRVEFAEEDTLTWTLGSNVVQASGYSTRCPADIPVVPTLHCVDTLEKPHLCAFGYDNKNSYVVEIPAGSEGNKFAPGPADRGQPSLFVPGKTPIAFNVSVDFDNTDSLTWHLNGQSITATKHSKPPCRNIHGVVPRMTSARFSNTLLSIVANFDSATNMAHMTEPGPCDKFFKQRSLGACGTVTCTWTSPSSVTIHLGTNPTIVPGDALVLTYGYVRDITDTSDFASGSVIVLPPLVPLVPTAVVSGPTYVTTCDSLTLDGSGSLGDAGRPMRYLWSVVSKPANSPLVLPASMRTAPAISFKNLPSYKGDYTFSLTVTNFMQQSSTAFHRLQVVSATKPVVFTRPSSPATVSLSQPLFRASGGVQTSPCFPCMWEFRYQWKQTCGDPIKIPKWLSQCVNLRLPTRLLSDSSKYCFTLTATHRRNPSITASSTLVINTAPISMSVTISGGGKCSRNSPLYLVAKVKADACLITPTYSWSCTVAGKNTPCIDQRTKRQLVLPTTPIITLPHNALATGDYVFSVTAKYKKSSASASTRVSFSGSSGPSVSIIPVSKYINPAELLKLIGSAIGVELNAGKISYLWSLTQGPCLSLSNKNVLATSITNPTLAINPKQLIPGHSYQFTLQASDRTGTSISTISVTTGQPPCGGNLRVAQSSGIALQTRFTISMNGWWSPISSALQYSFYYKIGNANLVPISQPSSSNVISVVLPAGLAPLYQITIVGRVQDSLRMFAEVSSVITITPAPSKRIRQATDTLGVLRDVDDYDHEQLMMDMKKLLDEELQGALEAGDDEHALRLVTIIAEVLNGGDEHAIDRYFDDDSDDTAYIDAKRHATRAAISMRNAASKLDMDYGEIRHTLLNAIQQINQQANELGIMDSPTDVLQQISSLALVTGSPSQVHSDEQVNSLLTLRHIISTAMNDGAPGLTQDQAALATRVISNIMSAALIQSATKTPNSIRSVSAPDNGAALVVQSAIATVNDISRMMLQSQSCDQTELTVSTPQISITTKKMSPEIMNGVTMVSPLTSQLSISLPDTIVSNSSDQCYSVHMSTWPSTLRMLESSTRPSSRVFEFSILDDNGNNVHIANLNKPITLHFPIMSSVLKPIEDLAELQLLQGLCQWWDDEAHKWSTEGCEMVGFSSDRKSVTCQCNHLTQFSVDIVRNTPAHGILTLLLAAFSGYVIIGAIFFVAAGLLVALFIKKAKKRVAKQSRRQLVDVELSALPLGQYALLDE